MFKPSALVIAGAVLATAGAAHAQQTAPATQAVQAAEDRASAPWYQRFTNSNGVTESILGDTENDARLTPAWNLNNRWNVTVDIQEARRTDTIEGGQGDQARLGAYYQFTPSVRVGGEVSVESPERPGAAVAPRRPAEEEPAAGVRVESAFRF